MVRYFPLVVFLCLPLGLPAQAPEGSFEGRPAVVLSNNKLELTVLKLGGSFASIVLRDDPEKLNPLWNPVRFARESGQKEPEGAGLGHFLCVDGFGPVSPEERAAGLPGHGEAHTREWEPKSYAKRGNTLEFSFSMRLPLVQEDLTRTVRMVDGENVIYVETELENLLAFDRPVCWAEHATIGSPFLKPGVTAVDLPAVRSKTRPYVSGRGSHRLASGEEFVWPNAPGVDGGTVDVRTAPLNPSSGDHTASLMDPSRKYVFVTAVEPERRLILGYLFKPEEFPWVQSWEAYPPTLRLARGLEFSTQPFDVPRREAIRTGSLFDAPTYRWLPARSRIRASFLMFFARTPEGMRQVDDVRLENGKLTVEDQSTGRTLVLDVSLPL
jgi:hypothetical protein